MVKQGNIGDSESTLDRMLLDYRILADIIVTVAALLVLSSFVPQIIKAYKTKRMFDVSFHLMALVASGMFLWVRYGILSSLVQIRADLY